MPAKLVRPQVVRCFKPGIMVTVSSHVLWLLISRSPYIVCELAEKVDRSSRLSHAHVVSHGSGAALTKGWNYFLTNRLWSLWRTWMLRANHKYVVVVIGKLLLQTIMQTQLSYHCSKTFVDFLYMDENITQSNRWTIWHLGCLDMK